MASCYIEQRGLEDRGCSRRTMIFRALARPACLRPHRDIGANTGTVAALNRFSPVYCAEAFAARLQHSAVPVATRRPKGG